MNQAIILIINSKGFARSLLFLFFFICLPFYFLSAQSIVHGKIIDTAGKSVTSANVLLVNFKDSILVKGGLTDQHGAYSFENVKAGKYLITATRTGNKPAFSQPFDVPDKPGNIDMGSLQLEKWDIILATVTVSAKKPLYEQKIDRLVINVASSIT